jgi:hypothetical protein
MKKGGLTGRKGSKRGHIVRSDDQESQDFDPKTV